MITEPMIEQRSEQPYLAIRTQAAPHELPTVIPQAMDDVAAWLGKQNVAPSGAPFVRYHIINMADKLDLAIGFPVASALAGDDHVVSGVLPDGRYAALVYTGDYSGLMDANRVLIEWAREKGIQWDRWDDPKGDAFGGRFEHYLTDPAVEPDPSKWQTEVAIRIAGSP